MLGSSKHHLALEEKVAELAGKLSEASEAMQTADAHTIKKLEALADDISMLERRHGDDAVRIADRVSELESLTSERFSAMEQQLAAVLAETNERHNTFELRTSDNVDAIETRFVAIAADLTDQLATYDDRLASSDARASETAEQMGAFESRLEAGEKRASETAEQIGGYESRLGSVEKRASDVWERLFAAELKMSDNVEALEKRVETAMEYVEERIQKAEEQLLLTGSSNAVNAEVEARVVSMEENFQNLRTGLTAQEERISGTETALKEVRSSVSERGPLPVGPDGEIIEPDASDIIKVPYVRIGTEGQVQLLAERLEALQKRMDLLTKTVSKLREA